MASLPSAPWVDIDSTRTDQDSPGSEDLFQDVVVDLNYLKNQADIARTIVTFQSSTTWTCPAGVTTIKLRMLGGGGGASRASSAGGMYAQGGGGGAWVEYSRAVVPATVYTINVGAGGQAGTNASGSIPGAAGGDTYFDTNTIKAAGGSGGARASGYAAGGSASTFASNLISAYGADSIAVVNPGASYGGAAAMGWGRSDRGGSPIGKGAGGNSLQGLNTETNGTAGFLVIEY